MTIKQIFNADEGNNIESIIFERIKRHAFMLYPFADVKPVICTVIDEKKYMDGVYICLQGAHSGLIMRIPQYMLIKMIAQEFYNPFFEDDLRELFKKFMENEMEYKKNHIRGTVTPANGVKPCLHIYFKENKPSILKRILGGLGL